MKHENYLYRLERISNLKQIWKCKKYDSLKCKARVHTEDDRVVDVKGEHNHVPDPAEIKVREKILEIKEMAINSQASTASIISHSTVGVGEAVSGQMPSVALIKRTVQRTRHRINAPPPNPANLRELIIPESFTKTRLGENFLLFDSGASDNRILIFSTQRNLQLLANCEHWYVDGTFKTAPSLFHQLYSIHGVQFNSVIPSVFGLLPDKRESTYERFFDAVKSISPPLTPKSIMTDFELASINAIRDCFPTASRRGCFFHFCQCIYRKVQGIPEINRRYSSEPDFQLLTRTLSALAFVPVPNVDTAFEDLMDDRVFKSEIDTLQPLVDYFEDTWIGRLLGRHNRRRAPLFEHSLWNCYDAVVDGLPKTNNAVEGWHTEFANLVSASHPTIWTFIEGIKAQQSLNEFKINQYLAGTQPPLQRQKYKDAAKKLKDFVESYETRNIIDYIKGVAHNIQLAPDLRKDKD